MDLKVVTGNCKKYSTTLRLSYDQSVPCTGWRPDLCVGLPTDFNNTWSRTALALCKCKAFELLSLLKWFNKACSFNGVPEFGISNVHQHCQMLVVLLLLYIVWLHIVWPNCISQWIHMEFWAHGIHAIVQKGNLSQELWNTSVRNASLDHWLLRRCSSFQMQCLVSSRRATPCHITVPLTLTNISTMVQITDID